MTQRNSADGFPCDKADMAGWSTLELGDGLRMVPGVGYVDADDTKVVGLPGGTMRALTRALLLGSPSIEQLEQIVEPQGTDGQ